MSRFEVIKSRERIEAFIKRNGYSWTVEDVISHYSDKYCNNEYVPHSMKRIIQQYKGDIMLLVKDRAVFISDVVKGATVPTVPDLKHEKVNPFDIPDIRVVKYERETFEHEAPDREDYERYLIEDFVSKLPLWKLKQIFTFVKYTGDTEASDERERNIVHRMRSRRMRLYRMELRIDMNDKPHGIPDDLDRF